MEVELMDIDDIKPYEGNPREIPESAVEAVAASISAFGFKNPCLLDRENVLIAGHTRVRAARKLGMEQVPVIRVDDLTPEQVKAFRIADNATGEIATWDYDLLPIELKDLEAADFDLSLLGFDASALAGILNPDGESGLTDPDYVPEPPDQTITQRGDIWTLGDHRLMCGDSRKADDMAHLMDGRLADMVWTDPPYGVGVASRIGTRGSMSSGQARAEGHPGIVNDDMNTSEMEAFLRDVFELGLAVCKPGAVWYVAAPHGPIGVAFSKVLYDLDIWHSSLVWLKDSMVLSRLDYHYRHEVFYYGWKPGAAHHAVPDRCQTSVFECPRPKRSEEHPTMKPVELIRRHIENSSNRGEGVLDQFAGSGSTLIACEQTGRKAFVMEIDPQFADVIIERWEEFTGRKAERVAVEDEELPKSTPAEVTGVAEVAG